jgi:tripartite-type tricarboxylate transporter receptor subunit TctC
MGRVVLTICLSLCAALSGTTAAAQYPNKPIRIVVLTPPGGPSDAAARALGQALSKSLGQPVVIENKPGAGGAIAAQAVLAAPADGYTLLWSIASMAGIPMLQKSPPFQALAEFTPVSLVGSFAFGLFAHPDVPARSLAELNGYLRANPDKLSYGTGTLGEYMAMAQLLKSTGGSALRVPYRGGSQLMPDLLSGRIQLNIGPLSNGLPHVRENKLRLLAVLLPQRTPLAPDVPTMTEAGLAAVALPTWQALLAPPKTPREIVERVAREVATATRDPALKAAFEQQGMLVDGSTPAALAAVIARDTETWRSFIREYSIPQE